MGQLKLSCVSTNILQVIIENVSAGCVGTVAVVACGCGLYID